MACNNSGHGKQGDLFSIADMKRFVSKSDALFRKRDKRYLKIYVRTKGAARFIQVKNFSVFPHDVVETLNLLYNESGVVFAFKDIPASESGDYFNTVTYYFYSTGETMVYKTNSSFFSDNCKINIPDDSRVTEIRTLYFNKKFKALEKEYALTDNNRNKIDSSKCVFNYRIEGDPLRSASVIPQLKNL